MLRFVIKQHDQDHNQGTDHRDYYTIDADVPELEAALRRGGTGPMGFERHELLGVELLGNDF